MASATREAIEATRDSSGIVIIRDHDVHIKWDDQVPLTAEELIRKSGWLIRPSSARKEEVRLYKTD